MSTLSLTCSFDHEKLYQKLPSVFHLISRHLEVGLKKLGCFSFFNPLLGFWISDKTLRVVFDILHKVCVSSFRCQVTPVFDARAITGATTKISVVGTGPSKIVVNICYIKQSAKQRKHETKTKTK